MTNKLYHLTDIHLNFLTDFQCRNFMDWVVNKTLPGDAIVITGDIAEAPTLYPHMKGWANNIAAVRPDVNFHFVLGNHDFYHGSIKAVRDEIETCPELSNHWLPTAGIVELSPTTALIGHDGFYDAGYADMFKSRLLMNDFNIIQEFHGKAPPGLFFEINKLAKEAANHVLAKGAEAAQKYEVVFVATHVPPFREAATYRGKISDDTWMPYFSSKTMGNALLTLSGKFPKVKFVVLCGHTHGESVCKPTHNMVCFTGAAEYGQPNISNIIEIE